MGSAGSCRTVTHPAVLESKASFYRYYRLGEKLGQGSYGCVYEALSRDRGKRTYAVKVQSLRKYAENLEREVRVWQKACYGSQNIVYLHKTYQEADVYFMVMEICYCSLQTRLRADPRWTYGQLVNDFRQLLHGMLHLHSLRIFHGDIKTENTLYGGTQAMFLKISDFGLSHVLEPGQCMTARRGTIVYVAPEMLGDRVSYSFPADMWSVGVLFFCIIVGIYPIGNGCTTFAEIQAKMREMQAEPPLVTRLAHRLRTEISEQKSVCQDGMDRETSSKIRLRIAVLERRLSALSFARTFLKRDIDIRPTPRQALQSSFFGDYDYLAMQDGLFGLDSIPIVDRTGDAAPVSANVAQAAEPLVETRRNGAREVQGAENEKDIEHEKQQPDSARQDHPADRNRIGEVAGSANPVGEPRRGTGCSHSRRNHADREGGSLPGDSMDDVLSAHDRARALRHPPAIQINQGVSSSSLQRDNVMRSMVRGADAHDLAQSSSVLPRRPPGLANATNPEQLPRSRVEAVQPPDDEPFSLILPGHQPDADH